MAIAEQDLKEEIALDLQPETLRGPSVENVWVNVVHPELGTGFMFRIKIPHNDLLCDPHLECNGIITIPLHINERLPKEYYCQECRQPVVINPATVLVGLNLLDYHF